MQGSKQEQRAGVATKRSGPAGSYAGVPAMLQRHTCVSKESLAREQVDPGGSRRSWPSEPIRLYRLVPKVHDVQQFLLSSIAQRTAITTNHRGDYLFGYSLPTTIPGKLLRHPRNLVIVELILFIAENSLSAHSPSQPRLPQGLH
jgi:hypothetical protein